MIDLLVALLVFCLIAGVLCFIARALLSAFKVPDPWSSVAYGLVLLLLLCFFLSEIGWLGAPHGWRHWR